MLTWSIINYYNFYPVLSLSLSLSILLPFICEHNVVSTHSEVKTEFGEKKLPLNIPYSN